MAVKHANIRPGDPFAHWYGVSPWRNISAEYGLRLVLCDRPHGRHWRRVNQGGEYDWVLATVFKVGKLP